MSSFSGVTLKVCFVSFASFFTFTKPRPFVQSFFVFRYACGLQLKLVVGSIPRLRLEEVFLGSFLIDFELSHNKLMSQIQPVVTIYRITIRKGKTYDVLSIQREKQ